MFPAACRKQQYSRQCQRYRCPALIYPVSVFPEWRLRARNEAGRRTGALDGSRHMQLGKNLAKQVGNAKGRQARGSTESRVPLPSHGNPLPHAQRMVNLCQFQERRWPMTSQRPPPASTIPERLSYGTSENMQPRLHARHCRSQKRERRL